MNRTVWEAQQRQFAFMQRGEDVLTIEVKAETNLRAKSLKVYHEMYHPSLSVRTSMADYERQDWLLNLPLYAVALLTEEGLLAR